MYYLYCFLRLLCMGSLKRHTAKTLLVRGVLIMTDMPRTNGELEIMVDNINNKLEDHIVESKDFRHEITELLKENTRIGQQTLEQATKTNGRMNTIEQWKADTADPTFKEYVKYKYIFMGGMFLISLCGILVYNLYLYKLKSEIVQEANESIIKTLEEKYYINITN